MQFQSEKQRKAVFAQMQGAKGAALRTGGATAYRGAQTIKKKGPGLIKRGQARFRGLQKKSPWGSELAIALPATVLAGVGAAKFKGVMKLAQVAGKKGMLVRGGTELGAAIAADLAVRRVLGGPGRKRRDAPIIPALGAGLAAETGIRLARRKGIRRAAVGAAKGGAIGVTGRLIGRAGRALL